MLFKDISFLELWQHFCSVEGNHLCNYSRRILWNYFIFRLVVKEEMPFKDIFI